MPAELGIFGSRRARRKGAPERADATPNAAATSLELEHLYPVAA
jgi:hypothetical protein